MLYLSDLDEFLDGPGYVFDRHRRIHAVLIEQVDAVGPQPLQRRFDDLLDVLRTTVQAPRRCPVWRSMSKPNFVAITTWSRNGANASPTSSSFLNGP